MPGSANYTFYTCANTSNNVADMLQNNSKEKNFVFAPFNNSSLPSIVFQGLEEIEDESILNQVFCSDIPYPEETSFESYAKQFAHAQEALSKDDLSKVILSRILYFSVKDSNLNPISYFKKLCAANPNTFNYLCYNPICGLWIGATPELLISLENNEIQSMALAGTRPAKENPPQWREKEKEEQGMVRDFVRNTFQQYFDQPLEESKTESLFTGSVWHLHTAFAQKINTNERHKIADLIESLHPTPAISGLPKANALKAIAEIEPHDRQYYTGYAGLSEADKLNYFVNLRCMRWEGNRLVLFLGGGITSASNLEEEWSETQHKGQTLLKFFAK